MSDLCPSVLDLCYCFVFFFKQKTAYEMRISDWSSDVCSSDLAARSRCRPGTRRNTPTSPAPASARQNPRPRRAPPAGCRAGRCPSAAAPLRPAARSSVERRQSSGLEAVRKQDQGNGSGALFRQVKPTPLLPLLAQRSPRSEALKSEL